MKHNKLKKW